MFVFSTVKCLKFADARKVGLAVALLATSLSVNAASSETVSNQEPVGKTPIQQYPLSDAELQHYKYPHWPHPQQSSREIIPPPPPGPYMSSALGDYSVKAPSFASGQGQYKQGPYPMQRYNSATVPMDEFSPDIPWPKNLRPDDNNSAARWMPEKGYRYAKPHNNYAAPAPSKQANRAHNYSNNYLPRMNDMRLNGTPIMPLTRPPYGSSNSRMPYGPYRNVPDYTRRNNHNNSQLRRMNDQLKSRAYPPE